MATQVLDDVIQGYNTIQSLDVDDLAPGEHKLWFRIATNAISQWDHLPVMVFKGTKPGKKILVTAGVHGDEYNGILTAQKVARDLVGKELAGTVTIVPGINPTGMLHHSRDFFPADPDTSPSNLNRYFPGKASGNETDRYLHSLWGNLLKPNADFVIDLHTQTSGTTYPLYVFADYRIEQCLQMARLMNPDVILNDPGDSGVLETVFNKNAIPCITVEIGMGRYTQQDLIDRAVAGIFNILKHHNVIDESPEAQVSCLEGNKTISIRAEVGGFVLPQVNLLDVVNEGDLLAIQHDGFGDEIHRYLAPESGTVLSHNIESVRAPGSLVVRLIK
ncbi:succinylglutamate desuccinylase/aspartoacylase family protein [Vibrio hannami]|uniref:succinylglutamate desuccinylase/aspartoacylase family protein n=1 Tax=Vibrio hannami TaxID=2717094 RepID=UPI00240F336A|nr:succinylglutamate desuccinylase/aspartoacylase family protein [Vibrio hannami]MDG3088531.1 succinylglutamate desuccinylase/aspartoacylase family protein [Vibrio hannami]